MKTLSYPIAVTMFSEFIFCPASFAIKTKYDLLPNFYMKKGEELHKESFLFNLYGFNSPPLAALRRSSRDTPLLAAGLFIKFTVGDFGLPNAE